VPLVVRLRSAVCLLGRFPALAGVDLDVEAGEIVLLAGPNGAGKTTLLRLVAGLVPLYSGEAEVYGSDLSLDRRSARRHLALVGHETFCYDDLTVRENLRFVAKASGGTGDEVDPVVDRLGLGAVAALTHAKLSAGQRRRLALGAAMVRNPSLLLLDEPHAGLDAEGREVLHEIVAAAPDEGRTVLMASHELDLARALATREVRVDSGRTTPVAGQRERSGDTSDSEPMDERLGLQSEAAARPEGPRAGML
jgi:heme ABC exporter ATP-binding subunit CcmA